MSFESGSLLGPCVSPSSSSVTSAALSGGKLSQRKAIDYALQIAHGLAAAHEKEIVHRDLKPDNLFVLRDGRVKILDFGLAKLTQTEAGPEAASLPTATGATEPGVVLGTLGYMCCPVL